LVSLGRARCGNPLADQSSILTCRNSSVAAATAGKEVLTRLFVGGSDVVVDGLTGLLGHLEPDRLAGLLLAHRRAIDSMSVRRHIFHLEADDVAASQFAIDGQIEHREIACSSFDLQLAPNRPNRVWAEVVASPRLVCPCSMVRGAEPERSDLQGLAWSCSSVAEDDQPVPPALWSISSHLAKAGN